MTSSNCENKECLDDNIDHPHSGCDDDDDDAHPHSECDDDEDSITYPVPHQSASADDQVPRPASSLRRSSSSSSLINLGRSISNMMGSFRRGEKKEEDLEDTFHNSETSISLNDDEFETDAVVREEGQSRSAESLVVDWEAAANDNKDNSAIWKHLHEQGSDPAVVSTAKKQDNLLLGYGGVVVRYPTEHTVNLLYNDDDEELFSDDEFADHDDDESEAQRRDDTAAATQLQTQQQSQPIPAISQSITTKATDLQPLANWDTAATSKEAVWKHLRIQDTITEQPDGLLKNNPLLMYQSTMRLDAAEERNDDDDADNSESLDDLPDLKQTRQVAIGDENTDEIRPSDFELCTQETKETRRARIRRSFNVMMSGLAAELEFE